MFVASVAAIKDGKILFGRRRDNGRWALPGGKLEPGEIPLDGAKRELKEESGLSGSQWNFLGAGDPRPNVRVFAYTTEVQGEPSFEQDPDREFSVFRWEPIDNVPADILYNLHSPVNTVLDLMGITQRLNKSQKDAIGAAMVDEITEAIKDANSSTELRLAIKAPDVADEHLAHALRKAYGLGWWIGDVVGAHPAVSPETKNEVLRMWRERGRVDPINGPILANAVLPEDLAAIVDHTSGILPTLNINALSPDPNANSQFVNAMLAGQPECVNRMSPESRQWICANWRHFSHTIDPHTLVQLVQICPEIRSAEVARLQAIPLQKDEDFEEFDVLEKMALNPKGLSHLKGSTASGPHTTVKPDFHMQNTPHQAEAKSFNDHILASPQHFNAIDPAKKDGALDVPKPKKPTPLKGQNQPPGSKLPGTQKVPEPSSDSGSGSGSGSDRWVVGDSDIEPLDTPAVDKEKIKSNAGLSPKGVVHSDVGSFLIKPYHEIAPKEIRDWVPHPQGGWSEMTSQALYHAADIGHLHQKVSVHNLATPHGDHPHVVIHMDPGFETIADHHDVEKKGPDRLIPTNYAEAGIVHPQVKEDAKKMAVMDFLTGNFDRHRKNIMVAPKEGFQFGQLKAIDHGAAFSYGGTQPERFKNVHGTMADHIHKRAPGGLLGHDREHFLDKDGDPVDNESIKNEWKPAMDWWKEQGGKVRAEFDKHLAHVHDPELKTHIQNNFDHRANYLDDMAESRLDIPSQPWHSFPVKVSAYGEPPLPNRGKDAVPDSPRARARAAARAAAKAAEKDK